MPPMAVRFCFEDWGSITQDGKVRADVSLTIAHGDEILAEFKGRGFPARLDQVRWRRRDSAYKPEETHWTLGTTGWARLADEMGAGPLTAAVWASEAASLMGPAVQRVSNAVVACWASTTYPPYDEIDSDLLRAIAVCGFQLRMPEAQ